MTEGRRQFPHRMAAAKGFEIGAATQRAFNFEEDRARARMKLPVIPGTSIQEIKERLKPFVEAGATRLVVPYVPVSEPVIEDARRFVEAWGKNS